MYTITLNNPGGELDSRTAKTPEQAALTVIDMMRDVGELHDGDTITIEGEEGDE